MGSKTQQLKETAHEQTEIQSPRGFGSRFYSFTSKKRTLDEQKFSNDLVQNMSRRTTDELTSITTKYLSPEDKFYGSVRLRYTLSGQPVEHHVQLTQTACHYGNVRYWFKCEHCQRRVGVLYLSGDQCACRKCLNLAYQSENESRTSRLCRKVAHTDLSNAR